MKKFLIIGLILAVVGGALCLGAFAANGWRWNDAENFESKTYVAQSPINELSLNSGYGDVTIIFYDEAQAKIDYEQSNSYRITVEEKDGKLLIGQQDRHVIGVHSVIKTLPKMTVYLPKSTAPKLDLEIHAGTCDVKAGTYGATQVEVHAGTCTFEVLNCSALDAEVHAGKLTFETVNCESVKTEVHAGELNVKNATVARTVEVDVAAGETNFSLTGKREEYHIGVEISAGSCNVSAQTGTTEKRIHVEISAGNAIFKFA